jgi:hypothetical protein
MYFQNVVKHCVIIQIRGVKHCVIVQIRGVNHCVIIQIRGAKHCVISERRESAVWLIMCAREEFIYAESKKITTKRTRRFSRGILWILFDDAESLIPFKYLDEYNLLTPKSASTILLLLSSHRLSTTTQAQPAEFVLCVSKSILVKCTVLVSVDPSIPSKMYWSSLPGEWTDPPLAEGACVILILL